MKHMIARLLVNVNANSGDEVLLLLLFSRNMENLLAARFANLNLNCNLEHAVC